MKQIGMSKIIYEPDNIIATFPETTSQIKLITVDHSNDLLDFSEFNFIFGYRINLSLTITKMSLAYYASQYGITIENEFANLGQILNKLVGKVNVELKIYPNWTNSENDFYLRGVLWQTEISPTLSGMLQNIGQETSFDFITTKTYDGETYTPDEAKSFYLPNYLVPKLIT